MRRVNILIVDDDPVIRSLLRNKLEQASLLVIEAANYDQAIQGMTDSIDVILLDIVLGKTSGFEVLTYAKQHYPEIPVMMVSGHTSKANAIEALKKGASEYFEKPMYIVDLVPQLIHAIQHQVDFRQLQQENLRHKEREIKGLQRQEQLLRSVTDAMSDSVMVCAGSKIVFVNCSGVKFFAATHYHDLLDTDVFDLFPTVYHSAIQTLMRQVRQGKREICNIESLIYKKGGKSCEVELRVSGLTYLGEDYLQLIFRDISRCQGIQNQYRTFFESSYTANLILQKGCFVDCNPMSMHMFGYTNKADLLSKHPGELSPEYQSDGRLSLVAAEAEIAKAFTVGANCFEWEHQKCDGTVFPAEVMLTVTDIHGQPALQAIILDISDRKRVHQLMQESEHRLRNILGANPVPAMITSIKDGSLRYVNQKMLDMVKFSLLSSYQTMSSIDFYVNPQQRQDLMARLLQEGRIQTVEIPIKDVDGKVIWVLASLSTLNFEGESCVITACHDITQSKKKSIEQHKYYEELQSFATASQAMMDEQSETSIYREFCLAVVNIFSLEFSWAGLVNSTSLKIEPIELAGSGVSLSSIQACLKKRTHEVLVWNEAIKSGHPHLIENTQYDASCISSEYEVCELGIQSILSLPLIGHHGSVIAVIQLYSQGKGFFSESRINLISSFANQAAMAIENVRLLRSLKSRVKRRTHALEIARDDAQLANRAKSTFLANMSHELRTPLNSILGFSELLALDKDNLPAQERQLYLSYITESGVQLKHLIKEILDLSKVEAGKMILNIEPFSVRELLLHNVEHYTHALQQSDIILEYQISDDVELCCGDIHKMQQVLDNILSNARKFTGKGGSIYITAEHCDRYSYHLYNPDASQVNIVGQEMVLVSIMDTGIGVAEEDKANIFKPFQQVDEKLNRKYEGTGLGLSLARKIMQLHGGELWLQASKVGQGSTFSLMLPCQSRKKDDMVDLSCPKGFSHAS